LTQIENEYGSYGDDKAYLHRLITLARGHLGQDAILYVLLCFWSLSLIVI